MKSSLTLSALLLLWPFGTQTSAQTKDTLSARVDRPPIIDTVMILGNKKTKDFVILNEMTLKPGMAASLTSIEYDRMRIYSLGLFTRVDIDFQRIDSTGYLIVDVSERWYIIPIPIFGFRDGDPKHPFYGAGVLFSNFRGVNQKLFVEFSFGADPSAAIEFQDPLFDARNNLSIATALSLATIKNRSQLESAITGDFDEHHYDASVQLGKRFSLFETGGVGLAYDVASVTMYRTGRTASPGGRDAYISAVINYSFDSRDLREYAMQGSFASASIQQNGFGESHVSFTRYGIDVREYTPLLRNLSVAMRAYASLVTGGTIPTYARAYIGYINRIRGYYQTIFEGDNSAGGTVELRYSLLRARTLDVTDLPIPEEFARWRLGISLALFADAGKAWFRGDPLKLDSIISGYGGGIHILLPYGYVGRIEYAFNDYFKGQLILDLRGSI